MAVKVIDPTPDEEVLKKCVCRNCGVKLQYVPNDIKEGYDTDYTGSRDSYGYIMCPNCNHEVKVRNY